MVEFVFMWNTPLLENLYKLLFTDVMNASNEVRICLLHSSGAFTSWRILGDLYIIYKTTNL